MKLTIHRGTHEVGGNCVEVNSGTTRIILDVGLPLFDADRRQLDTSALRGHSVDELLRAGIAAKMSPFRIELDELRANPSRYVMVFRPSMLASDFDNELPPRSRCLYSSWYGYLDREDWQPVKASLDRAGGYLIKAHISGHIFAQDIIKLVNEMAPKLVIPIHTFEPQNFEAHFQNVRVLNDGEPFEV